MGRRRAIIVGGGFGGLRAAIKLKGLPVDVTIVDRENHNLFQPLLYQVATAGLSPDEIAVPIRALVHRLPNVDVVLGEVVGVDTAAQEVSLQDGSTLSYDYLIGAAGAQNNWYGNDTWEEVAFGLKDLPDAIRLREHVLSCFEQADRDTDEEQRKALLTFVVIGGGPTGVELAGAISELGRVVLARDYRRISPKDIQVILLEMADRVLTPFAPELSAKAKSALEEIGVEVRCGGRVTDVTAERVEVEGTHIETRTVCWASGVKAAGFAGLLPGEKDRAGRVVVKPDCSIEGHPNIFAVGDMASFTEDGQALPGVAQVALQQGQHVARVIRAEIEGRRIRPTFRYKDKGIMATIGRARAIVESGPIKLSGFIAFVMWAFVHIVFLIGGRNRLAVLTNWIWSYLWFKRGARLITGRHNKASQ